MIVRSDLKGLARMKAQKHGANGFVYDDRSDAKVKSDGRTDCVVMLLSTTSAWLAPAHFLFAQEIDQTKALKVKAAYLYNFAKFVEWPEKAFDSDDGPFVVGILGDDPLVPHIQSTVDKQQIQNRSIKIRQLHWYKDEDREAIGSCHMLYVSGSESGRLAAILTFLRDKSILSVSDLPHFAKQGGMIGFVLEGERIVFEINRPALEQVELKASEKLLRLARLVTSQPSQEQNTARKDGSP